METVRVQPRKSETLLLFTNLSPQTLEKMDKVRAAYYALSNYVEDIGVSRELSESFTLLESSLQYAIKHLCMADPQAVRKAVEPVTFVFESEKKND